METVRHTIIVFAFALGFMWVQSAHRHSAGASDNRDSSKVADSTANTVVPADGTRTAASGTDNGSVAGHKNNAGTGCR